ncbi:hypothetical protein M5K25_004771 [Dendrobium thyrsiflorum]|uniref:Uncharacterized protein n=1 Tax=Dendrobium thyrsiflorum TaxID=117978 RepID=A0ABD0VN28_DENTH
MESSCTGAVEDEKFLSFIMKDEREDLFPPSFVSSILRNMELCVEVSPVGGVESVMSSKSEKFKCKQMIDEAEVNINPSSSFKEFDVMIQVVLIPNVDVIAVIWFPLVGTSKENRSGLSRCSGFGLQWDPIPSKLMDVSVLYFDVQGLLVVCLKAVDISSKWKAVLEIMDLKLLWLIEKILSVTLFTSMMSIKSSVPTKEEVAIWSLGIKDISFIFYLHYEIIVMKFEILPSFHFLPNWEF